MATHDSPAPISQHKQVDHSQIAHSATPSSRAGIVLGVLCLVYVLNFLCRQLPAILGKQIEDSLHLTDGQFGMITGLYFAMFYTFISIPIGYLADRTSRSKVLALACAIWSGATMACGMAVGYVQFAISFVVVGFGEAGGVPPSYAIISDYFPPSRRGSALGIFNLGPPIGAALGVAFGASIAASYGWRAAFISLGAVGIFAVLGILFIVREPPKGGLDSPAAMATGKAGFGATLANFCTKPSLLLAAFASGANQFVTYGMGYFVVIFLLREKGMTLKEVAVYYALVLAVAMSGSMFVSGRLLDWFTKRSKQAYALLPAISLVFAIPFYIGFVWAPVWSTALLFLSGTMFLNYFYLTSSVTLVQQEVRPDQRVMSGALLLLVMNFIGLGLGPTYVGAASDFFHASFPHHALQMALYTLVPFYVIAIVLFLCLARVLRRESRTAGEKVQ
ncbi:MAG: MFS transporter [Alphaproteobacteria bacterium]|nr:MFS transporter [Alphaproteobacteria bacterium]MDE1986796.1 MFS transporter [Alphaproteobacteria bacterium]MDE2163691.1 MFS transporter [Alphaproteobacteria bacterium]MDE2265951.1 MFS transporter [Alphaproteobacteria bacterium]MDE2499814.1 MFS transporter [Alphaproteobacteria bacterium]